MTTYDSIAQLLADKEGAVPGKMWGMPTLFVNGNAFAGQFHGKMVFKLTGLDHQEALSLTGSELFDPGGYGRPMKEWVLVPQEYAEQWPVLAKAALQYVGQLPGKKPKAKTQ